MTRTVVCIVEGDGEVRAVPLLLRRIAEAAGVFDLVVPVPIRVHKDQFLRRQEEFSRKLLLAAAKAQGGAVLVILDADDDCPVALAADIASRAHEVIPHVNLRVVIARREFEAWLLGAVESLAGKRGLPVDIEAPPVPDDVRNAKGWLSERMVGGRYHEVSDQPAFSAQFDIELAQGRSRSFRRLIKVLREVMRPVAPA